MNGEAFTILDPRSFVGIFRIMAAKTLKNLYRLQTATFKLSLKEKKTKVRKEKPKVTYSEALVIAFLVAENANRQLEKLPTG